MSVSLFQTLTPLPDQEMLPVHILEQGEILKFKKYESISLDEKNINYIFYIKEGIVSTFRETIEGERKTLHIIGRGYFLFESYYFSQKAVQIRCSGLKNSVLIRFSDSQIKRLVGSEPIFINRIAYSMGLKMQLMGRDLLETSYASPAFRLKLCVDSLAKSIGENRGMTIRLSITHSELAELVGLHRVSVSRILEKWKNAGILQLGRGELLIDKKFFSAGYPAGLN